MNDKEKTHGLSMYGIELASKIARCYGISQDAVASLMRALDQGGGTMAQFNHADLGGSGQWMKGGMTMVSDMFNNSLRSMVDNLCSELSEALATQDSDRKLLAVSLRKKWWPENLDAPNSAGSQNHSRYAYFREPRRLVVDDGNSVVTYDTGNHDIGGFSQQQSASGSICFSSQQGPIELRHLKVVARESQRGSGLWQNEPQRTSATTISHKNNTESGPELIPMDLPSSATPTVVTCGAPENTESEYTRILNTIERLAELNGKGVLTDEEYLQKKTQLLNKLS